MIITPLIRTGLRKLCNASWTDNPKLHRAFTVVIRQTLTSPGYQPGAFHIRGGVTILIYFFYLSRTKFLVVIPVAVFFEEILNRAFHHLGRLDQAFLMEWPCLGINVFLQVTI